LRRARREQLRQPVQWWQLRQPVQWWQLRQLRQLLRSQR